jgi:peroxiredoxin
MANEVQIHTPAPEFSLEDYQGRTVRLSDFLGKKCVFLVFNRGFM